MTKNEAHSSSASEGGITNTAYLNEGEEKEENEEGKGKGQEGWQKKFIIPQFKDRDSIHLELAFDTDDVLGIEFILIDISPQFRQYTCYIKNERQCLINISFKNL